MTNVCASSELDIFVRPPVQTSILSSRWVEYTPIVNYDRGTTPILIEVTGTKGEYIDLSNVYFYTRASIRNDKNELITPDSEIGPINYIQNTMFKQLDVSLNKKLVSMPCDYAYRSYIEGLMNYGRESKNTHLETSVWIKDNPLCMDSVAFTKKQPPPSGQQPVPQQTPVAQQTATTSSSSTDTKMISKRSVLDPLPDEKTYNDGLMLRRSLFAGRTCEMYGRLHADIFNIDKLLLDEVNLEIKLYKNNDNFCLLGTPGFKLQIDEFVLNVRKVRISDQVLVAHAMALERTTAFYPVSRVEVHGRTINKGVISDKFENLIKGPLPKKIVLGMIESSAYNGLLDKNPFNFQSFGVKEIAVSIDGEQAPYQPFQFSSDPTDRRYVRGYYSLFSSSVSSLHNGNDISLWDYPTGYHLIALDLAQDGCVNTDHFNPEKTGNLRIKLTFDQALNNSITVILYYEYESHFEITKLKNVVYQYVS